MSDQAAPRPSRTRPLALLLALAVPALAILLARWFDSDQLEHLRRESGATFNITPIMNGIAAAHLLTPALILAIVVVGWRSRSALVGVAYVVVGGLLVLDPALTAAFAVSVNNAPTVAPEPVARFLSDIFASWEGGVTTAVGTIAGVIFLVGVGLLVRAALDRRGRVAPVAATVPTVPTVPTGEGQQARGVQAG